MMRFRVAAALETLLLQLLVSAGRTLLPTLESAAQLTGRDSVHHDSEVTGDRQSTDSSKCRTRFLTERAASGFKLPVEPLTGAFDLGQALNDFLSLSDSGDGSVPATGFDGLVEEVGLQIGNLKACTTDQCLGCVQQMLDEILFSVAVNASASLLAFILNEVKDVEVALGIHGKDFRDNCPQLYPSRTANVTVSAYRAKSASYSEADKEQKTMYNYTYPSLLSPYSQERNKTASLGIVILRRCEYTKGTPLRRMGNTLGLCNFCTSMRILPISYYPRFINEVVCDDNDTSCLSNYGFCKSKSRAVEVFLNNGTQEKASWTKVSISVSVSCECYVPHGSELHEFVST